MDRRAARQLLARLTWDADRICARFGLRYRVLEAERANVKARYGICYDDGTIKIRLRHATTGEPLKYSSLVNTLCHELAHLRHFNHGPRFQDFYARLLAWARREGIYRPGPERRPAAGPGFSGRIPAPALLPLADGRLPLTDGRLPLTDGRPPPPSSYAPAPPRPPPGPQQLDLFS